MGEEWRAWSEVFIQPTNEPSLIPDWQHARHCKCRVKDLGCHGCTTPLPAVRRRVRKGRKKRSWGSWPCMSSTPGGLRTRCWGPRPAWGATARPRVRQEVWTMWTPPPPDPALNPGRGPCLPLRSGGEAKGQLSRKWSSAPLVSLKMIKMSLWTKHKIDKNHKFSLVMVRENGASLSGLTDSNCL